MFKPIRNGFAAALFISVCMTTFASAEVKHIQLSLFDQVQLYSSDTPIHGLRLSIYGVNKEVNGVDVGIVPRVTGDFKGYQWGALSLVEGSTIGIQAGFLSITKGDLIGAQESFINICNGKVTGVQGALINITGEMSGVQFGLFNYTKDLYGFQIGAINLNMSGKPLNYPFLFLPIVNFAF